MSFDSSSFLTERSWIILNENKSCLTSQQRRIKPCTRQQQQQKLYLSSFWHKLITVVWKICLNLRAPKVSLVVIQLCVLVTVRTSEEGPQKLWEIEDRLFHGAWIIAVLWKLNWRVIHFYLNIQCTVLKITHPQPGVAIKLFKLNFVISRTA